MIAQVGVRFVPIHHVDFGDFSALQSRSRPVDTVSVRGELVMAKKKAAKKKGKKKSTKKKK
jgi:hypothetical protein